MGGRPTVRDLMLKLKSVMDWEQLGLYLGLETPTLETVKINSRDVNNMKIDMFNRWLNATPDAAWSDVVSALIEMNKMHIAREIERDFCSGSTSHVQGKKGFSCKGSTRVTNQFVTIVTAAPVSEDDRTSDEAVRRRGMGSCSTGSMTTAYDAWIMLICLVVGYYHVTM